MVLHYLQRRTIKIILLSIVAVKVLEVDSQTTRLECDGFQDMETTTCNCSVAVESDHTANNCDPAWNTAYITAGDKLDNIDESSFPGGEEDALCLCCYRDMLTGQLLDKTPRMSGTTCRSLTHDQGNQVLEARFVVNKSLLAGTAISCVVPCLSGKDYFLVSFIEDGNGIRMAKAGLSIMMIVAVVASIGVVILLVPPLTLLFIKYQRKWAWIMSENKPMHPPPLPTVQNSGLIYIVDPKGLILPLGDVEDERPEASGTLEFTAHPMSTPNPPNVSATKNVATNQKSKAGTVNIKTPASKPAAQETKPEAQGTKPQAQETKPAAQSLKPNPKNVTEKTGEDHTDVDFKEIGLLPTVLNSMKKYGVDPSEKYDTSTLESTES